MPHYALCVEYSEVTNTLQWSAVDHADVPPRVGYGVVGA